MRDFWDWHIRYRIARWLLHLGMRIWPESNSKREVSALIGEWSAKVVATNAINRARLAARSQ